jgi:hypothetical protein
MASNTVNPTGARPWGEVRRANWYVSGGAIYPGDWLIQNSSGQVVVATSSTALCGVAATYTSASTQAVLVYDHPDQTFVVKSSGTYPATQADFLYNFDVITTAGSSTYKLSRMALNGGTHQLTTATIPLKALTYDNRPDNVLGNSNLDVVVIINNHSLKGGTGTTGV